MSETKVFDWALKRAGITTGDVTPHTLRHTAITRMLSNGIDDFTVMELVGHLTRRMLKRYTHPPTARKQAAPQTFDRLFDEAATVGGHKTGTRQVVHGGSIEDVPAELLDFSTVQGALMVDAARIELATSALRTRRSPS